MSYCVWRRKFKGSVTTTSGTLRPPEVQSLLTTVAAEGPRTEHHTARHIAGRGAHCLSLWKGPPPPSTRLLGYLCLLVFRLCVWETERHKRRCWHTKYKAHIRTGPLPSYNNTKPAPSASCLLRWRASKQGGRNQIKANAHPIEIKEAPGYSSCASRGGRYDSVLRTGNQSALRAQPKQRGAHRTPRTVPVQYRYGTGYDTACATGFVKALRTGVQCRYGTGVVTCADPREITSIFNWLGLYLRRRKIITP